MSNVVSLRTRDGRKRILIGPELRSQFMALGAEGVTSNRLIKVAACAANACGPRAMIELTAALASGEPVAAVLANFARLRPDAYRAALAVASVKGGAA